MIRPLSIWARLRGQGGALHAWHPLGGGIMVSLCGLRRAPGQIGPADHGSRCARCARANDAALAPLRIEARRRWGQCTAFRLGLLVGKCQLQVANPYALPDPARRFAAGVVQGATMRWEE